MADGYAPALFLEVLAFWFILRWLLTARLILFFGRLLVLMMLVGLLGTLGEHRFVWTACFAGSALLAWMLLRRWRGLSHLQRFRLPRSRWLQWRGKSSGEAASLCERRIGLPVDAAAPATVTARQPVACVMALAGDGIWVLEDDSGLRRSNVGRVLACWDRAGVIAHVEHSRRGEQFELSWPRQHALVRGTMPPGPAADALVGHLVADELANRS